MIAENDLIDVINEIHQYSMILFETPNKSLYGIFRNSTNKATYLHIPAGEAVKLSRPDLVKRIVSSTLPKGARQIGLDEFLSGLSEKKTRHIWLEQMGGSRGEMGFISIRELKAFLRAK
jgi:hypothetical protein